jgi:hypothetical protein
MNTGQRSVLQNDAMAGTFASWQMWKLFNMKKCQSGKLTNDYTYGENDTWTVEVKVIKTKALEPFRIPRQNVGPSTSRELKRKYDIRKVTFCTRHKWGSKCN